MHCTFFIKPHTSLTFLLEAIELYTVIWQALYIVIHSLFPLCTLANIVYTFEFTVWFCNLGGRAIAIPGMIKGLVHAYKKFGRSSWKSLVQPAIEFAEQGFEIHSALNYAIGESKSDIENRQDFPALK